MYYLRVNQSNGLRSHVIIEVECPKHEEFKRLLASDGVIALDSFGTIHYNDWENPSTEQKAYFREKFGLFE